MQEREIGPVRVIAYYDPYRCRDEVFVYWRGQLAAMMKSQNCDRKDS